MKLKVKLQHKKYLHLTKILHTHTLLYHNKENGKGKFNRP